MFVHLFPDLLSLFQLMANKLKKLQGNGCCTLKFFCLVFPEHMSHLEICVRNICRSRLPDGCAQEKQTVNFLSVKKGATPLDIVTSLLVRGTPNCFKARLLDTFFRDFSDFDCIFLLH